MLIFLYGPDSYRRGLKQKEILEKYKAKHSALTIDRFDLSEGEEEEKERCEDFLKNRSLFDSHKLAVITSPFLSDANLRMHANDANIILLLVSDKAPPEEWQWLLEKPVISQEFELLTGSAWKRFINQEIVDRKLTLDSQIINALATVYQGDSWGLVTELDKLALLNIGTSDVPNIDAMLRTSDVQNIGFIDLIKTISWRGNLSTKIPALEMLLHNEDHGKVFNILAAFTSGAKKIQMADYDVAIKSGKLDYETALIDFVLER